jgi:hypothetical protein
MGVPFYSFFFHMQLFGALPFRGALLAIITMRFPNSENARAGPLAPT